MVRWAAQVLAATELHLKQAPCSGKPPIDESVSLGSHKPEPQPLGLPLEASQGPSLVLPAPHDITPPFSVNHTCNPHLSTPVSASTTASTPREVFQGNGHPLDGPKGPPCESSCCTAAALQLWTRINAPAAMPQQRHAILNAPAAWPQQHSKHSQQPLWGR